MDNTREITKQRNEDEEEFDEQPVLCRIDEDNVLTGHVNKHGHVEWEWARISAALNLETSKDGVLLKRGLAEFERDFEDAQLNFSEFHYRGQGSERGKTGMHTMESRALLLMLALFPARKQVKTPAKDKALKLTNQILTRCMQGTHSCVATIRGTDAQHHTQHLVFLNGLTEDLGALIEKHAQAEGKWKHLSSKEWCQHRISSSLHNARIFDLMLWLVHCKVTRGTSSAWVDVGLPLWPRVLFMVGSALEQFALTLSQRKPEPAPLLKSKSGNTKRIPFVNKVCLLRKLSKHKTHRKSVMQSHGDLVPEGSGLIRHEALIECQEYLRLLKATFSSCTHFQVSWDPSTYSGDEVMVATVWSNQCQCAAYLPIQYLLPVDLKEVDVEFRALVQRKEITRVHGFAELRAVSHGLSAIDKDLSVFEVSEAVLWKPMTNMQTRTFRNGKFFISNTATGEEAPQLPDGWSFAGQHMLVSISDQGGINRGVLDYCQHMLPLAILVGYDSTHRCYNDLKSSMRTSSLFKAFLGFAIVFNINYAPFSSKACFSRKVAALKEICDTCSFNSNPFLAYVPYICQERNETEDGSPEQRQRLFEEMKSMRSCQIHGPLTKLMRWYSWWQGHQFYAGDLYFTKLVMQYSTNLESEDYGLESDMFDPEETQGMSARPKACLLSKSLDTSKKNMGAGP